MLKKHIAQDSGNDQAAQASNFATRLLQWFDAHGRKDLPWQQNINAYRVWVSEIMLQQTQVATVIPYYQRFMQSFPTVAALAAAADDVVLHHWSGLGYYSRARNLHAAAKIIAADLEGKLPGDLESWQALPGIGRSTAAAICSISFESTDAILDGNVKRVLARHFAVPGWPGHASVSKKLWQLAELCTPSQRNRDYSQAIMDLGATLCVRSKPRCRDCPLATSCEAKKQGNVADFPGRKPKRTIPVRATRLLMLENSSGELLLLKRPPAGIWGGLWSLPEHETFAENLPLHKPVEWPTLRHTFTHFHLDITPVHCVLNEHRDMAAKCAALQGSRETTQTLWYDIDNPPDIGLPAPISKLLAQVSNARHSSNADDQEVGT
ncbi:MAG: A/G-specific adenine glycosylase [Pseudomonadales bacterium]|nr:A/G-specific adenine glycosylase [Pseudomonadales bacterium]